MFTTTMKKSLPRKGARRILENFFKNSTIHAFNFFCMPDDITTFRKIFWALVNIVTISLTILWIRHIWLWYVEESTNVNFDGTIPLHEVDHPGLAICGMNKISKKRAYAFAKELSRFVKGRNETAIMEDIRLLGNLYDFNLYGQERFRRVQEIIDKYDNKTVFYDPTARLIELTTPCNEVLLQCRWDNRDYPCGELFLSRMTYEGLCCVFNYIRPSERTYLYKDRNLFDVPTEPKSCHGPGIEYGLEVVLNNNLDDYFYTTLETTGYKVHFFLCKDFPDVLSGSLQEFLIGVGEQCLFSIEIEVIKSAPEIKAIPIQLRNCKFEHESRTSFGIYRQSDCFVECKLRSMQALCNCVPFVMPLESNSTKFRSICSLIDIPCVNQYLRKWSKYFPKGAKVEELEFERHDSLVCECLPTCDSVNYEIYTNNFPIDNNDKNISKINIFFVRGFASLYKIDMTYTWFEIISTFGGLMSLLMGVSLISIIEVFVMLYKLLVHYISNCINI